MGGLRVKPVASGNLLAGVEPDFGLDPFTVGAIGHEILTGRCYRLVSEFSYHWNISSLRPFGKLFAI